MGMLFERTETDACFLSDNGHQSFEQFIDINLRHFSGERHDEDAEGTDYSLARLSWLGSDMGRVSAAIKICILEPGFAVPPGL